MISKVVTLLEREGLVERLRDPDDGRAWRVQVSDHGQRWFDAALPALERLVDAAT